jgi:hypothetical protein
LGAKSGPFLLKYKSKVKKLIINNLIPFDKKIIFDKCQKLSFPYNPYGGTFALNNLIGQKVGDVHY